jgi:transposase
VTPRGVEHVTRQSSDLDILEVFHRLGPQTVEALFQLLYPLYRNKRSLLHRVELLRQKENTNYGGPLLFYRKMVAIPTLGEEDAKRPSRERESLVAEQSRIINRVKSALARLGVRGFNPKLRNAAGRLVDLRTPEDEPIPPNTLAAIWRDLERRQLLREQIKQIETARLERLGTAARQGPSAMVRLLACVLGLGIETADMLVHEVLSRDLRDRRAVARYAGLTGSPDESGGRRRERGLARSGNARVRCGMIEFAWRFLRFQKDSALARWYEERTAGMRGLRKKMIVALARKLLIALWRLVREGVVPDGLVLRPAS